MNKVIRKVIYFSLCIFYILILGACGFKSNVDSKSNTGDINQDIIHEDEITEDVINQIISSEIYLKEIVIVEDNISEQLLQEDDVEEVVLCKTIYIPEDSIEEFSNHSQTDSLFDNVKLQPLLNKITVGTGIILTLSVIRAKTTAENTLFSSIVASAAPSSFKGAVTGSLIGGLVGVVGGSLDGIDESGRLSAVVKFSTAVVGLIVATLTKTFNIVANIAIAGINLIAQGVKMIKALTSTPVSTIDWSNVNWNKVGVSAAQQAINNVAAGYMWGSIFGAIKGGIDGYEAYENYIKFSTPYSKLENRKNQTPKIDSKRGYWTGERGESSFVMNEPIKCKCGDVVTEIPYKNGVVDFSKYAKGQVNIKSMTDNRIKNFKQADELLAKYWKKIKYNKKINWTDEIIAKYRSDNGLTWHELNNMKTMQLVPTEINSSWGHLGGVGEYNVMMKGGSIFD